MFIILGKTHKKISGFFSGRTDKGGGDFIAGAQYREYLQSTILFCFSFVITINKSLTFKTKKRGQNRTIKAQLNNEQCTLLHFNF